MFHLLHIASEPVIPEGFVASVGSSQKSAPLKPHVTAPANRQLAVVEFLVPVVAALVRAEARSAKHKQLKEHSLPR